MALFFSPAIDASFYHPSTPSTIRASYPKASNALLAPFGHPKAQFEHPKAPVSHHLPCSLMQRDANKHAQRAFGPEWPSLGSNHSLSSAGPAPTVCLEPRLPASRAGHTSLTQRCVSPGVQVRLTLVLEHRSPPAPALCYPVAFHLAASTKPGAGPKIEI